MQDTIINLGIIGSGGIAHFMHLPALQEVSHAQVVACADVNAETAHSLATRFAIPDVTTDYH